MREHFFIRFGAGQPEILKERETIYLEGMPDSSGLAFPPRVHMEDKLDSLEAEREYLLDICIWKLMHIYFNKSIYKLSSRLSYMEHNFYLRKYKYDHQSCKVSVLLLFCKQDHYLWVFFTIQSFCKWYFFER